MNVLQTSRCLQGRKYAGIVGEMCYCGNGGFESSETEEVHCLELCNGDASQICGHDVYVDMIGAVYLAGTMLFSTLIFNSEKNFGSVHKLKKASKMSISCNNIEIEARYPITYLGVTLDQDMTWKTMGGNAVRKINIVLKFLYRKSSLSKFRNNTKIIPKIKTQGKKTFVYNGAKLWNSHDVSMRSSQCKDRFKEECKKLFFLAQ